MSSNCNIPLKHNTLHTMHQVIHGGAFMQQCQGPVFAWPTFDTVLCSLRASHADHPQEDITCVMYDAFDFMEAALLGGGKVLVHCHQGVSRSTTIAIAFLMLKTNQTYDDVYKVVRAKRGVTSPNVGFMCQLINWGVSTLKRAEFWFILL
jgi:protein-tyrosine phosphatase